LAAAKWRTLLLVAIGADVLLALAILIVGRRARKGTVEAGGPKRVVVLPFENLGAAEDDYLADGIADAVRGRLASLPGLEVIARACSAAYKRPAKSPVQITRELGVCCLLRATVRRQKGAGTASRRSGRTHPCRGSEKGPRGALRATPQDPANGMPLWASRWPILERRKRRSGRESEPSRFSP